MGLTVAPQAIADLDEIWFRVAREGGTSGATRLVEALTERFRLLGEFPWAGRPRDDLRVGLRSFRVGLYLVFHRIEGDTVVILRVIDGRRDLVSFFTDPDA